MSVETVLVRRVDNGRELEVPISEIRWWLKLDKPVAAFGVTRRRQQRGDAPYIRRSADSRWCVRVEFVEESKEGYRRELARIMGRGLIGEGWTDPDAMEIEASGSSISDGTGLDPTGSQPAPSRLLLAFRAALRSVPPALVLLLMLGAVPASARAYKRPAWADDDHDCLNTREEAIVSQCMVAARSEDGCRILWAVCSDRYTGTEIATDSPGQGIHADHLFPASEAWKRRKWAPGEFERFYNDDRNLVIVRARTNLRKNALMPDEWCPSSHKARPWAARKLRETAKAWLLRLTPSEEAGLRAWERGECAPGARAI